MAETETESENELLQELLKLKDRTAEDGYFSTYQAIAQAEQVLLAEIVERAAATSGCNKAVFLTDSIDYATEPERGFAHP